MRGERDRFVHSYTPHASGGMTSGGWTLGSFGTRIESNLVQTVLALAPKVPLARGRYSTHYEYRVQWEVPQFTDEGKERKAQVPRHA